MLGYFHQPTHPISIFLESPLQERENFDAERYNLKIELDSSASYLPFEPLISIIRFCLQHKTEAEIDEILALPQLFTVLKPIIVRFIKEEPPGSREPLNTDEVAYEQIEVFKAMACVLQNCVQASPIKVAIVNAQYLPPSTLALFKQEEYRIPSRLQLDLFLPTSAFQDLNNSQGFNTQIKRRHLSAANNTGQNLQSDHVLTVQADMDTMWTTLRNAISLYCSGELLSISNYLNKTYDLNDGEKSEIITAQMYAWILLKDPERCHIHMQELQLLDFDSLSVNSSIRTLKAICVGNLCLQEFFSAEKTALRYRQYAQQHNRIRDILLSDFYIFLSQSFSGQLHDGIQKLKALEKALADQEWPNLSAFVKCSYWFNELLLTDEPLHLIDACLESIDEYENLENIIGQSTAHHHISIVLGSVGKPKEAISHINRALKLTQQCGLSVRIHNTLNGLSFLLNGLGQTEAAKEAIEAAYPLVLSDGNFDQICTTLYNLALIAFYADHLHSAIQLLDDVFSIMEYRNMSQTRFRNKEEMLAMQAIAAYLDGDRRLPHALRPQLGVAQPRSHEGEAFLRCIGLITQDFNADEAEHFFMEISEEFSKLRQNRHLELLALRLLVYYLRDIGENARADTWSQQGIRQCKTYQLYNRECWFKNGFTNPVMKTTVEPKQAITMAQRQLGIDALMLENGLLHALAAFNESALRSSTIEELVDSFLANMQKLVNVRHATIKLSLADDVSIERDIDNIVENDDSLLFKQLVFNLHFIGGTGTLTVTLLGDLIAYSRDAQTIVIKICDRLSSSIEFILDRLDSHRLAYHDALTEVYNRSAFEEDIQRILSKEETNKVSLAFIDLDKFKSVNDTYGHVVGDQFLKSFVSMLEAKIRADDRIYRLGGDEFLVCFQDIHLKKAELVLTRFIDAFFNSATLHQLGVHTELNLGCSVGLIEYHPHTSKSMSVEELLSTADKLMYQAKRSDKIQILSQVIK